MDRMPEVGDVLIAPSGNTHTVNHASYNGGGYLLQLETGSYWGWEKLYEDGWRIKEDNVSEQPQWPDEAFQKALTWANAVSARRDPNPRTIERAIYDEVRAEERRREPKVCGAKHPEFEQGSCQVAAGHEGPHKSHCPAGALSYWYDPPQCDKAHTGDVPAARYLVISPGSLGGVNLESADSWTEALDICGMDFGFDSYIIDRNEKKAYFEGREAECDRPHMTEAAQRAIGKVLKYGHAWNCYKETHAGIPSVDGEPHICTCGRDALRENYDREAQS